MKFIALEPECARGMERVNTAIIATCMSVCVSVYDVCVCVCIFLSPAIAQSTHVIGRLTQRLRSYDRNKHSKKIHPYMCVKSFWKLYSDVHNTISSALFIQYTHTQKHTYTCLQGYNLLCMCDKQYLYSSRT